MKKQTVLIVIVLFAIGSCVTGMQSIKTTNNHKKTCVVLSLRDDGKIIAGAEVEVYTKDRLELVKRAFSDADGNVKLDLLPNDYIANAITNFDVVGVGHIGSVEFTMSTTALQQKVTLPMRLKSDHSSSVSTGPSSSSAYSSGLIEIPLQGDGYGVPLMMTPNAVHEHLSKYPISTDYEQIWFNYPYLYGVIDSSKTRTYIEWHPIALVDSEYGLTHKMDMSFYESKNMILSSEVAYAGVSASAEYHNSLSYDHGDDTPIICSNGESRSRLSEFKHVYQEGTLWMLDDNGNPQYRGTFQREWIDRWYTLSQEVVNGWAAGISETRERYLGEWRSSTSQWINMREDSSMSLGFSVARGDTFGYSTKLHTQIEHSTEANHQLAWNKPSPDKYLRIYSGNLFDINTYVYTSGGGGGSCPYVSGWDGNEYILDNNILPQAEIYGTETDWVDRYKLENHLALAETGYLLRINEFDNEHSYIDSANLIAVEHDGNARIAVSPNGIIMAYNKPKSPFLVVTADGKSLTNLVTKEDELYFSGVNGDVVFCSFRNNNLDHGARLVLRADAVVKDSIHIDILTSTGWNEVGVVIPRIRWAHEILDIGEFLDVIPDEGTIDFRLRWTASHKLDFIGLDTKPVPEFKTDALSLVNAFHSSHGDVLDFIHHADDVYAEIYPGQSMILTFEGRGFRKNHVSFVFVVEGKYYTL